MPAMKHPLNSSSRPRGSCRARSAACCWWPRTTRSSRPTRTSCSCRRSSKAPRTASPSNDSATSARCRTTTPSSGSSRRTSPPRCSVTGRGRTSPSTPCRRSSRRHRSTSVRMAERLPRGERWLRVFRACWVGLALLLVAPWAPAQQLAPIPALDSPVVDTTGTLDPATVQQLETQALALQQRKGSQLQVLLVPTTLPEDIAQYAVRVYDQWRLGREGVDDGLLLVVATEDRRVRIEVGYGLEGAIPDATAARVIQEYLVPRFRAGDFAGGVTDAPAALVGLVDGEPLPEPMAGHPDRASGGAGGWLAGLFAAFIAAQVVRGVLSRAPRPLRGVVGAGVAGGAALLLSGMLVIGGLGAL